MTNKLWTRIKQAGCSALVSLWNKEPSLCAHYRRTRGMYFTSALHRFLLFISYFIADATVAANDDKKGYFVDENGYVIDGDSSRFRRS